MNLREIVSDLVFIIRVPIEGVEFAVNESAKLSRAWNRVATILNSLGNPWMLPRDYRRELVALASTYFSAGSDPGITFLALMNKYTALLNQQIDFQTQALVAITVLSIMIGVLSFLIILGVPPIVGLVGIVMVPVIHYFQVEITRYDYGKPSIAGIVAGAIGYALGYLLHAGAEKIALLVLFGFGIGFAVFYIPQFLRFIRDYAGLGSRVLKSFGELLNSPSPEPLRPITIIERELMPLWDYAYSVGVREFVERIVMVVSAFVDYVKRSVTTGLVYGPFITIGYVFTLFTAYILSSLNAGAVIANVQMPITFNVSGISAALIPLAVSTAILTGKAMHSIGLGVVLIPLFLIPLIPLTW
ncbi:hypothetical protein [Vulcanisaeta distributa]|uniref:Uncharacterized protein n=1 Tax=Vulcanisaeta distributa (strain DSM 14429 / JCM 11212 / NBRC 100878 / IC-017) TaxID=572478 RepID=E1QQD9_VULDI|nr:hypothetical protein [Vulcanisaeta distributa]ADN51626.1 hypothetical protein Vdis_2258 [Vulcanisaeta distributa DSM 14429]